jgi:hypothetical protein
VETKTAVFSAQIIIEVFKEAETRVIKRVFGDPG